MKKRGNNVFGFTGTGWGFVDILLIVLVVVGVIAAVLYFLNRWASKRVSGQQEMIEKTKQAASIYVIDKKHDKATNVNLPKIVTENLPKASKFMKMYFVKAKVGPQIHTLMCEKAVYNALDVKKTFQVEMAGMFIASVKGMKSKYEIKQAQKAKKLKAKQTAAK